MSFQMISSLTEVASSMDLITGRISLPAVEWMGRKFYSPVPSMCRITNLNVDDHPVAIDKFKEIILSSKTLKDVYPGNLVGFSEIRPNKFLRTYHISEGYFGEAIISNDLYMRIRNVSEIQTIRFDDWHLVVPFTVNTLHAGLTIEDVLAKSMDYGTTEAQILALSNARHCAFMALPFKMVKYVNADVVKILKEMDIMEHFEFRCA